MALAKPRLKYDLHATHSSRANLLCIAFDADSSARAISDGAGARSPPFGSVPEDGHYQSGGAGPSGAPNSAGAADSKRAGRFDAHDSGSVSDSGAHIHHTKFKRTRRALHLKASDRERLRGPLKALDWRRRSMAIDEDGDETDAAAADERTPSHAAAAGAGAGSSALTVASGKDVGDGKSIAVPQTFYRVATYCVCELYDLSECIEYFERSTSFKGALTLYTDVLYIKNKRKRWDIFIFSYGCVTFFNVPVEEEELFLKSIKPFETGSVETREVEDFEFAYGSKSAVRNDEIILESTSALEKLSVAFAIAQCCKLSIFEERIQKEIDRNKHLPEALSREGKIDLTQREITREIGRLFIERNSVNLHFDILDTPEFFWEQDKYKAVYDRLAGYLELGKRVDILNKRLDIMKELFEMLNDQIDSLHASKLEWIVIWLIVIEVVISVVWQMLIKDILHLFPSDGGGSS